MFISQFTPQRLLSQETRDTQEAQFQILILKMSNNLHWKKKNTSPRSCVPHFADNNVGWRLSKCMKPFKNAAAEGFPSTDRCELESLETVAYRPQPRQTCSNMQICYWNMSDFAQIAACWMGDGKKTTTLKQYWSGRTETVLRKHEEEMGEYMFGRN